MRHCDRPNGHRSKNVFPWHLSAVTLNGSAVDRLLNVGKFLVTNSGIVFRCSGDQKHPSDVPNHPRGSWRKKNDLNGNWWSWKVYRKYRRHCANRGTLPNRHNWAWLQLFQQNNRKRQKLLIELVPMEGPIWTRPCGCMDMWLPKTPFE